MDKPENHKFSELVVGMERKFYVKINEELVLKFAKISGDYNPLHVNDEFAKKTKFKKRVCHGMLLSSFFSKLVGMYIPGLHSLYLSQTLYFEKPCFIDDQIIISGKIKNKSESTKIITLDVSIHNQLNQCLVSGEAKTMILEHVNLKK
jgi:3-hydroxybutyryl-CoA dehydratase